MVRATTEIVLRWERWVSRILDGNRGATLSGTLAIGALAFLLGWSIGGVTTAILAGAIAAFVSTLAVAIASSSHIRQVDDARALWTLHQTMSTGRPWMQPGGWALSAGAMQELVRQIELRGSRTLVELGPGVSSLVLATCCPTLTQRYGLEHDPDYVSALHRLLRLHSLDYTIIHAPLSSARSCKGREVRWYSPEALVRLPDEIDVLIIDGPPNWDGAGHRDPAWKHLRDRLRPGALVLIDDTDRANERALALHILEDPRVKLLNDNGDYLLVELKTGEFNGSP